MSDRNIRVAAVTVLYGNYRPVLNWVNYYTGFADSVQLIIHDQTPKELLKECEDRGAVVVDSFVDSPNDIVFSGIVTQYQKKHQKRLLKDYDATIICSGDEFIVADPSKYSSLREYISTMGDAPICTGKDVVMSKDEEVLDLSRPLLEQRECWVDTIKHSRIVLSRVPVDWQDGNEFTRDMSAKAFPDINGYIEKHRDPDLLLVHTKYINNVRKGEPIPNRYKVF